MSFRFAHDTLILDANCVINLYASQRMAEILATIPPNITIATYVAEREAQTVFGPPDDAGKRMREPIRLQPLIDADLLQIISIESEQEAEYFATFSAMTRDRGEAVTGAIALHHNWAIALDDKNARRLFTNHAGHLQLVYTLEIVKHWVDAASPSHSEIISTLQNIRQRARYAPTKFHPLWDWWHSFDGG
jgi:hypothetical protein